jgi:site-specific recombinase XerD
MLPVLDQYEQWLTVTSDKRRQPSTVQKYTRLAKQFLTELGNPKRVTPEQVRQWQENLRKSTTRGIAAQNVAVSAARTFLKFIAETEGTNTDRLQSPLKGRRIKERKPKFVDRTVLQKVFNYLDQQSGRDVLQDRAIWEVLYGSGLRRSEAAVLTLGQFLNDSQLRVIGKGDKERMTIVTGHEIAAVRDWALERFADPGLRESLGVEAAFAAVRREYATAPLFVTSDGREVPTLGDPGKWIWGRVQSVAKRAGIGEIGAHQLRHSFATHLMGSGKVSLSELKDMLGHSDLETTLVYLGLEGEAFDRVRAAHPRA